MYLHGFHEHSVQCFSLGLLPVDHFEHPPGRGPDKENIDIFAINGLDLWVNRDHGEALAHARPDEERARRGRGHCPVHQGVVLDEVQAGLGQLVGVIVAQARARVGDLTLGHGKPVGVYRFLELI